MGDLKPVRGVMYGLLFSLPVDLLIVWLIWRAVR